MEAISNDFSGESFVTLGIDFWDGSPALVQSFRDATGVTFPLLMNGAANGIGTQYNCSYHYFFVIDHEGFIYHRGFFNNSVLRAQIADALSNISVTPAFDIPSSSAKLHAAYPNPFNPMTRIPYQTALEGESQMVKLDILDIRGRIVRTIVDSSHPAGFEGEAIWDGNNSAGERVPSGTYMYRLQVGKYNQSRLMTLIK